MNTLTCCASVSLRGPQEETKLIVFSGPFELFLSRLDFGDVSLLTIFLGFFDLFVFKFSNLPLGFLLEVVFC